MVAEGRRRDSKLDSLRERLQDWVGVRPPKQSSNAAKGVIAVNSFVVEVENRPGELVRVTETLAARGVNLLLYSLGLDGRGDVVFLASDEETTRSTLRDAGISFREFPLMFIRIEDRPGQVAAASRKLADEAVNIEIWLPVDTRKESFTVALGVDNTEIAQKVLSDQLTTFSYM